MEQFQYARQLNAADPTPVFHLAVYHTHMGNYKVCEEKLIKKMMKKLPHHYSNYACCESG